MHKTINNSSPASDRLKHLMGWSLKRTLQNKSQMHILDDVVCSRG